MPCRRVDPWRSLAHFRSSSPVGIRIRDPGQGKPGTARTIEEVLEEGETQEARRTIALKGPVVTRADQFEEA